MIKFSIMRKNDAFIPKILHMCWTKIFMAIFANFCHPDVVKPIYTD